MKVAWHIGVLALVLLVAAAVATHPQPSKAAETNARVKRVLVLDSFGREFSPFNVMSASVQKELARQSPTAVEHHEATIEAESFEERINEQATVDYLRGLSAKRRLDLIITVGGPATVFANHHRQDLLAGVPLVAELEQRRLNELGDTTNTVIIPFLANLPGVLDDILRVLPATTNVAVILGASPLERYWVTQTKRMFASLTNRLTFTYLNDLTLEAMCSRVGTLPPHSAVFYLLLMIDSAGVPHEQGTGLTALHAAANAPIFSLFEHELGMGIVGGRLTSMDAVGRRVAEASLRVLKGEPADAIKGEVVGPAGPVYDWRELRRWGIREDRLPAGSEIRFRQPTTWEEHKWQIIGVAALCALETALIIWLVVELRWRRRAELERQRSQDELAHVTRVATMGQLAATLAHEINQPLGAILYKAEAAKLFLEQNPPDYQEVKGILAGIEQEGERAGAVIDRMRTLLKRRSLTIEPLSLGELFDGVAMLTRPELEARRVRLQVELPPGLPPVQGDRVQLQQVLINLLINGAEATAGMPPERRWLVLRARHTGDHQVEASVTDNGHGIPANRLARIFEPFSTTKPNGMGLGLAISQTIVNAHGGRIWAENNADGGASVRFTLKTPAYE